MHLFQTKAVKDFEAAAVIPVIDYGSYFRGEPGALQRLAQDVRLACENIGFFYALNHGVPQDTIDRVLNHAKGALVGTYNRHRYLDEKRHALVTWAEHVVFIVGDGQDAANDAELLTPDHTATPPRYLLELDHHSGN